jgi:hypothetical protein
MALVTATEDYGTARAIKAAEAFLDNPFLIISGRETFAQCMLVARMGAGE